MKRRALLVTAGMLVFSGCASEGTDTATTTDETTTQHQDTTTPATESATDTTTSAPGEITPTAPNDDGVAQLSELRYHLEEDLTVESFYFDGGAIKIAYTHKANRKQGYIDRLAYVVFDYAGYVAHDGKGEVVEARTVDEFGDTETEYRVERHWVEAYNTDESVSDEDLMVKVLEENDISIMA